jgi:serine phosphatase RsbU (regulator of sigma subunit)
VGGDTFDFSLDRNTLHVSMTDAMGHSVASALPATLVVGPCGTRAGAVRA